MIATRQCEVRVLVPVVALILACISGSVGAEEADLKPLTLEELNELEPAESAILPVRQLLPAMEIDEQEFYAVLEVGFLELRYLFAPPTGKPSPDLTEAIKAFQRDLGHEATGTLLLSEFEELSTRLVKISPIPIYVGRASIHAVGDLARVSGTWEFEDDTQANPVQSTIIDCNRRLGTCTDATATIIYQEDSGQLDVHLQTWTITKWSESEIVAENDQAQCVSYTLSINLRAKEASMFRRGKGIHGCDAISTSPQILRLVDGFEGSHQFFRKRRDEANRLTNPRFRSSLEEISKQ